MSTQIALLVLLAAAMHAGWNLLIKSGGDRFMDTTTLAVFNSLIGLAMTPFFPLPTLQGWFWLAVSGTIHIFYYHTLIKAYTHADLSLAYPLMRGLSPLFVLLITASMGQAIEPRMLLGIAILIGGIVLPAMLALMNRKISMNTLAYAVANAAIIGMYTVVDATGISANGDTGSYIAWLFVVDGVGLFCMALHSRGRAVFSYLKNQWRPGLMAGMMSVISYGIVLWATQKAPVSSVSALRETSVVFAALFGAYVLKEPMKRVRLASAVLVVLGCVLIKAG